MQLHTIVRLDCIRDVGGSVVPATTYSIRTLQKHVHSHKTGRVSDRLATHVNENSHKWQKTLSLAHKYYCVNIHILLNTVAESLIKVQEAMC